MYHTLGRYPVHYSRVFNNILLFGCHLLQMGMYFSNSIGKASLTISKDSIMQFNYCVKYFIYREKIALYIL